VTVRRNARETSQPRRRWPLCAGLLSALLLSLVGCSVGPEFARPQTTVNPEWSDKSDPHLSTQTPADSAWWNGFHDPALDTLVDLAYRQNLTLQVAGLRIMEARAQLGLATGRKWPQVQAVSASATAVGLSNNGKTPVFDRNFWDYQVGFDAFWELDFWGKYRRDIEAQRASYFAAIADYEDALVSLLAEVARTYAVIRTQEVLLAQARANATLQEDGLRIAQSRFRNGATSELDVAQATTLLESTRATIPQLEANVRQAENALCTLLGQPTGTVDALLTQSQGIPVPPEAVAVSVPAELLRRRPDVRSAELNAASQCARIGVAKADLYPSFALAGSIGSQTSSLKKLFSAGSFFYSVGPRAIWTIFNYGRIENNVRIQDARFEQLLMNYHDTVLRAAQEVEDQLTGYLKAREAAQFAENAANGAQRSVDISLSQYREGAVDYQRVLDAERSLLQEQNTLAETRSSIATNLIALYKALGGGWEMHEGQPYVSEGTRHEMEQRTNWGSYLKEPHAQHTSNGSSETPR